MNATKLKYIKRAEQHQAADDFRQGFYWKDGKGCCIGCLAHANENAHCELEKQTNIPEWLSRVADTIHEGLTVEESKQWPVRFIKAVPDKVFTKEWSENEIDRKIKAPFLIAVLKSTLDTFDHEKYPDVKAAVDGSIVLWQRDDIGSDKWKEAARAAARAAAWEAARGSARAAAWEAARGSVTGAARAAWEAARAAEAVRAKYTDFSNELIRIMEEAENDPI